MSYANKTSVPVDRSMNQVRQVLRKYGASGVAIAETDDKAATQFVFERKSYKFVINYPSGKEDHILYTSSGRERTEAQIETEVNAEKRRLWRCMVLYIKASVEAHANGLADLKRTMIGHMVLPSGKTFYQTVEHDMIRLERDPKFMIE